MSRRPSMNTSSIQRATRDAERPNAPAILFDLDGTLLDSNYAHVAAWQEALDADGVYVPGARIHRCVGMSGKLMLRTIFSELGRNISASKIEHFETLHKKRFEKKLASIQ